MSEHEDATVSITEDVKIPQALLDAQTAGSLVLFVGAGASVDKPSDLPLFDALARQLSTMARIPYNEDVPIDSFLGSMPATFDTHVHARDLIARSDSEPNTTHAAIVRLASAIGPLRVVTTNFDDHLETSAASEGIDIRDKWVGPALPLGDDFAGVVHLHGSILRPPRDLVLTDQDFGRAYVTYAWATRFLLPMFQKFTVLFVGYSHDDPIMRYLALGLPSGTPRYAFTPASVPPDPKWQRLTVTAIEYPVTGHDHSALVVAIQAWDLRARMGQFEHRARMEEIVKGGTILAPVERDYLVGRLQTADGAREFAQSTSELELDDRVQWLHWAETLPEFRSLFAGDPGSEATVTLGNWFCHTFIAEPVLHGTALQTVLRLGQSFSDNLFRAACWSADALAKKDVEAGRRWKALLATSVTGHSAPVPMESLLPYLAAETPEHLAILRVALQPFLALKRRWYVDESDDAAIPDAEVRWNSDADSLTSHVLRAVEKADPGDIVVGALLENSLNAAYGLLDAFGTNRLDGLSYGRNAIEPHEQDKFRDQVDALIDGLRTFGESALATHHDLPERWWSLGATLFRRLALHLLATDNSRTPDEKIEWLLTRRLLYETDTKHEAFRVLESSSSGASHAVRVQLLSEVLKGPGLPDDLHDRDRHAAYATYNLLVWLTRVAPQWAEVVVAFDTVQAANPAFGPRDHPDLDRWMTSGTWGGNLPITPDEFSRSFDADPDAALRDLIGRDYSGTNFDEPEWEDAVSLVRGTVENNPELGARLWALIEQQPDLASQEADLYRAIIEGWAKADLDTIDEVVVEHVETQLAELQSAPSISRFLASQIRRQVENDETTTLARMREIASELWRTHGTSFRHSDSADPVSVAPLYLNSWPGDLTQYWMHEIDRRWRWHRDDWSGVSDQERDALTSLLDGPPHALDAIQPALANELHFMYAADAQFASDQILPLFRDHETARLAWTAYLHNPRYNDGLLAAGLLDATLAEWDRLDELDRHDVRERFFGLVVSVITFASITPNARQDLLDPSVLAQEGSYAAEFATTVTRFLETEGIDGSEMWNRWLREHVQARLNGVPRIAEAEELARWADAVPFVGQNIEEAVNLFAGHQVGLGDRFHNPSLSRATLEAHGHALVDHYAERVRNSTPAGYFVPYQVRELISSIREVMGDLGVRPLEEAATGTGFLGPDVN